MTSPRRALLLIDVQQQYVGGLLEIHYPPHVESLPRILAAIDAAEAAGIPIVAVQHSSGSGAPVFDPDSPEFLLLPEVEARATGDWKRITKSYSSVFADTDLAERMRARDLGTATLVGSVTSSPVLASAADAECVGFEIEVLSDATGAINLANAAGTADAKTVHTVLMTLLNSSWASVANTDAWIAAVAAGEPLSGNDLGSSAAAGAAAVSADR